MACRSCFLLELHEFQLRLHSLLLEATCLVFHAACDCMRLCATVCAVVLFAETLQRAFLFFLRMQNSTTSCSTRSATSCASRICAARCCSLLVRCCTSHRAVQCVNLIVQARDVERTVMAASRHSHHLQACLSMLLCHMVDGKAQCRALQSSLQWNCCSMMSTCSTRDKFTPRPRAITVNQTQSMRDFACAHIARKTSARYVHFTHSAG
jgi:hypothetical protein